MIWRGYLGRAEVEAGAELVVLVVVVRERTWRWGEVT